MLVSSCNDMVPAAQLLDDVLLSPDPHPVQGLAQAGVVQVTCKL